MKKTFVGHLLMIGTFITTAALISAFHLSAWWMSAAALLAVVLPYILSFNLNIYMVIVVFFALSVVAPLSILILISPGGDLNLFDYLEFSNIIQLILPTVIATAFVVVAKRRRWNSA